ncbi:unnamed protein product [Lactuca virosa]|uniref:Uncharacterized protein n=1 Tax=Lactuca virosa TaxID=75947 RepID=A0AAU9LU60_9ASTR|nr:unnamed protein product [Lactuca virosa]
MLNLKATLVCMYIQLVTTISIIHPSVPFILVDGRKWRQSYDLRVKLVGSKHPLALTTVYHNLQPIN